MTLARRLLTAAGSGGGIVTPETLDEEFNHPLGSQWAVLAGAEGHFDVDDTVPGALFMGGPEPASYGIYKPIPPIPFTVTAKITEVVNDASGFSDMGIMLGEATPGAFIHGCWDVPFLGQFWLKGSYWSDPDTWEHNIQSGNFNMGGTAIPHYSRFVVNSQDDIGRLLLDRRRQLDAVAECL